MRCSLILSAAAAALPAPAAAQSRLGDFNSGSGAEAAGAPRSLTLLGSQVLFTCFDPRHGRELWTSDGTPAGTQLVLDLLPGQGSALADTTPLVAAGSLVFFRGSDRDGPALWATDGTAPGTRLLARPPWFPEPGAGAMAAAAGAVYFMAGDGTAGLELWRSDGTAAGTGMVVDLNPGGDAFPLGESQMCAHGGSLYFTADNGATGVELWRANGTQVALVADLVPGTQSSAPRLFQDLGATLLCAAGALPNPLRWFRIHPGGAGASLVAAVAIHESAGPDGPAAVSVGTAAYFVAAGRNELWRTDGTGAGTVSCYAFPANVAAPGRFARFGGLAVFHASDGVSGVEPWRTDGTAAGTLRIADLSPGPASTICHGFAESGGRLLFVAQPAGMASGLWRSDGSAAGTQLLRPLTVGRWAPLATASGLWLAAEDPQVGEELWRSDGTAAGTVLVHDVGRPAQGSWSPVLPAPAASLERGLVLTLDDGSRGAEPWWTEGTPASTRMLADLWPGAAGGQVQAMSALGGAVYWLVGPSPLGPGLWRSDGTVAGTARILTLPPPGTELQPCAGRLCFAAFPAGAAALWSTDGTAAGTREVFGFGLTLGSGPRQLTEVAGLLYFAAEAPLLRQAGVWRTDGTAAGTRLVLPTQEHRSVQLCAAGASLFVVSAFGTQPELWKLDPGGATQLLQWPAPAGQRISPPEPTALGQRFLFVAHDPATGTELYASDGTPAGTGRLLDVRPGPASSMPSGLVRAGDTVYFAADDGVSGVELWRTDGTAAGTRRVVDLVPGPVGAGPFGLTAAGTGRDVVFAAWQPATGLELWASDGTAAGTRLVADLTSGPASSSPRWFQRAGTNLVFMADDGTGYEPWVVPLAALGGSLAAPLGTGCAGSNGRVPLAEGVGWPAVGNSAFSLRVSDARPMTAGLLLLAAPAPLVILPGGCAFAAAALRFSLPFPTDALGAATVALPVPPDPTLAGAELQCQMALVDPGGALSGVASLSGGLLLLVGR